VVVKTNFPLGDIIPNKNANGHIVKWAMELCPTLVDFIVEWTDLSVPPDQRIINFWQMYFDGSL
jgi:hypothetical protein